MNSIPLAWAWQKHFRNLKYTVMKRILLLMLLGGVGFTMQACKKNKEVAQGKMEVRMTDSPGDFVALNVQIMKIEAYLDNSGWVVLNETTKEINVLDLTNGAEVTISNATTVQPGLYTKLRLTFSGESSLTINGASGPNTVGLSFNSNYSHQVEIPVHCQVNSGITSSILLDFNVALSVKQNNQGYELNPVVTEIVNPETGVQGHLDGTTQAAVILSNGSSNFSTYVNNKGYFMIRGVPDGTYLLKIEGKQSGDAALFQKSIQNVTISEGQIKSLGTIQM